MNKQQPTVDRSSFLLYFSIGFILICLLPTFWRIFGYGFSVGECLRTAIMDIGVCSIFLFVFVTNPLRYFWGWAGLLVAVMVAYFIENPPQSPLEWGATFVAFGLIGRFFPLLHTLNAYVILGLFIGYIAAIRIMSLQIDYADAKEVLDQRLPQFTAAEGIHLMCNFGHRYALARERARWFVYSEDGGRARRLSELTELAKKVNVRLEEQGLNFIKFNSGTLVAVFPNNLEALSSLELKLYGKLDGYLPDGSTRPVDIQPFTLMMKKDSKEGYWLMDSVPADIVF